MTQAWTHKVVKSMRGLNGEYFDYPTAATFTSEQEAIRYAEEFAAEQKAAGVSPAIFSVLARKSFRRNGMNVHAIREIRI